MLTKAFRFSSNWRIHALVNALRFRRLCVGGKTLTAITTAIVISVLIAKRCWIASLTVLTFSRLPSVYNEVQRAESQ
jgi:hypothetical protein